jgi:subtilisin family serine protease
LKITDFAESEKDHLQNILFSKLRDIAAERERASIDQKTLIQAFEPNFSLAIPQDDSSKDQAKEISQTEAKEIIEPEEREEDFLEIERVQDDFPQETKEELQEENSEIEKEQEGFHESAIKESTQEEIIFQGDPVLIAIIDSGVDLDHPDLKGRIDSSWNFLQDNSEVNDELGHGTHLAGIIASNCPNAQIMALKFTDEKIGALKELVKAIRFAVDNGAEIINLSLGLRQEMQSIKEALDYANSKGVIVVAAAGNYRSSEKYYPAAYEKVIGVAALKKNGEKFYLSNFGEWVDFSISAQDIYSAMPDSQHGYQTGTSQAAALMTAKIANRLKFLKTQNSDSELFQAVYDYLKSISEPNLEGEFPGQLGLRIQN